MTTSITRAERCSGELRAWGSALRDSAGQIATVTDRLWSTGDPETALANSTAYLESVGHVLLAWIWLEQALAAEGKTGDFYDGKRAAARYFFSYELPKTAAQFDPREPGPLNARAVRELVLTVEWTGARYADMPMVEVVTWIDAPPERVWRLVCDIGLMPGLSAELQSVEWLDGASQPAVGARFLGRSRHAALGEWSTTSYVVEHDPCQVFAWAVEDPEQPSATWRFTLNPHRGGMTLSQWVRLGPGRSGLSIAIDQMPDKEQKIVFVRLREFEESMTRTLAAIKTLAEQA